MEYEPQVCGYHVDPNDPLAADLTFIFILRLIYVGFLGSSFIITLQNFFQNVLVLFFFCEYTDR